MSVAATVQPPPDMTHRLEGLRHAAQGFAQAWHNYQLYLQDPAQRYDFVQATPLIEKIGVAWQGYKTQRTETNTALRSHHCSQVAAAHVRDLQHEVGDGEGRVGIVGGRGIDRERGAGRQSASDQRATPRLRRGP